MVAAVWPLTLPQAILLESLEDGIPDGRIRTKTDVGPGKTRPRDTTAVRPIVGSMLMTDAQWAILETFVTVELLSGSLPFTIPDPKPPHAAILVQFGATLPRKNPVSGTKYRVSLDLEGLK